MRIRDHAKMWVKDQWANDEHISIKPKQALRNLKLTIAHMTPEERQKSIEHLKAYAVLYYQGRHGMETPQQFKAEFKALEKRSERLSAVDNAREVLKKFGGPPSWETIYESLERSEKSRTMEQAPTPAPKAPRQKTQNQEQQVSPGMAM